VRQPGNSRPADGRGTGDTSRWCRRGILIAGSGFILLVVVARFLAMDLMPGPFHHHGREREGEGIVPILLVGLALVALAVFVGARVLRGTAAPIGEVMDAADRLAHGDYEVRVEEKGSHDVRQLIASFNEMAARLQVNEEQRRRLLADVAHEMRTPLSVIRGNAEGMLDGIYPCSTESLSPIVEETAVMARLLDDLQTLSNAESGALRLYPEATDVRDLASSAVSAFLAPAAERDVTVLGDVPEDGPTAPPEMVIDPVRIRQVLDNLIMNAVRYTPAGGTVTVAARREGEAVIFSVSDTGSGIPPADLPHVFDRFTKAADSGGSGLGLAIARSLVEAHGGRIWAENTPASGAVFSFSLPLQQA